MASDKDKEPEIKTVSFKLCERDGQSLNNSEKTKDKGKHKAVNTPPAKAATNGED